MHIGSAPGTSISALSISATCAQPICRAAVAGEGGVEVGCGGKEGAGHVLHPEVVGLYDLLQQLPASQPEWPRWCWPPSWLRLARPECSSSWSRFSGGRAGQCRYEGLHRLGPLAWCALVDDVDEGAAHHRRLDELAHRSHVLWCGDAEPYG